MKPLYILFLLLYSCFSFAQDVWVDGYYRSNGTYVSGHYRTRPDNTINNNYSTVGNVNPYTCKAGVIPRESSYPLPTEPNFPVLQYTPSVPVTSEIDWNDVADLAIPIKEYDVPISDPNDRVANYTPLNNGYSPKQSFRSYNSMPNNEYSNPLEALRDDRVPLVTSSEAVSQNPKEANNNSSSIMEAIMLIIGIFATATFFLRRRY